MPMRKVVIYTTDYCPYCVKAKRLLDLKKVSYEEIDVTHNQALRDEMMKKAYESEVISTHYSYFREKGLEIKDVYNKIENKLRFKGKKEIATKVIGQLVLLELKKLDKVAYLRFASVYRHFEDPTDFAKELQALT